MSDDEKQDLVRLMADAMASAQPVSKSEVWYIELFKLLGPEAAGPLVYLVFLGVLMYKLGPKVLEYFRQRERDRVEQAEQYSERLAETADKFAEVIAEIEKERRCPLIDRESEHHPHHVVRK